MFTASGGMNEDLNATGPGLVSAAAALKNIFILESFFHAKFPFPRCIQLFFIVLAYCLMLSTQSALKEFFIFSIAP